MSVKKAAVQYRPNGGWKPEDFFFDWAHTDIHTPPDEFDRWAERNWMLNGVLPLDITDEATEAMCTLFEVVTTKGIL